MILKDNIRTLLSNHVPPHMYNSGVFKPGETPIFYSGQYWDNRETEAAIDAFLNGKWLTAGEFVNKFENEFSEMFHHKYSLMVNSGSSANLILIAALKKYYGWRDGDEIIVSPAGFPTTVSVIYQNRLEPTFADIEWETLNFDLNEVEKRITDKTVGVFLSPVLGNPPDMDRLVDICNENNIKLIIDCCDSLGSKWDGKYLTEYGVGSSCSFYPAHHLSCSFNTRIPYINEYGVFRFNTIENIYNDYYGSPQKIRVYVFDEEGKTKWVSPSRIIRHELGYKQMYRIKTLHGRSVDVTEDQSVFVLDESLNVVAKKSKDIKIGDYVVTAKNMFLDERRDVIDILKLIIASDYNINVENFPFHWLDSIKNRDEASQCKIRNSLPKKYIGNYNDDELKKMNLAVSQSKIKIPAVFEINKDVSRLIGYFMAEGSYKRDYALNISLHKKEVNIIDDIFDIVKIHFGLEAKTRRTGVNSVNISIESATLTWIFKNVLCIRKGACNKRIPYYIYMTNEDNIRSFIYGYTMGDGSFRDQGFNTKSIDVTSVSLELINDFQYLLSRVGISASFYRRNKGGARCIVGKDSFGKDNYTLKFSGYEYDHANKTVVGTNIRHRNLAIEQIPITKDVRKILNRKAISRKNKTICKKRLVSIYESWGLDIPLSLKSDLAYLPVRSIDKIAYENKYVYDFSVSENENFYGGFLGLFMHNSTGEGGMVSTDNNDLYKIMRSMATWGRSCFIQGTEIDTYSGLNAIEKISVGDKVFTHKGNYLEVKNVFAKNYSGELITIHCTKKQSLTCTADHEFLVLPFKEKISQHLRYKKFPDLVWVQAKDLKSTDYLVEKVLLNEVKPLDMVWKYSVYNGEKTEALHVDKDLMRLCG